MEEDKLIPTDSIKRNEDDSIDGVSPPTPSFEDDPPQSDSNANNNLAAEGTEAANESEQDEDDSDTDDEDGVKIFIDNINKPYAQANKPLGTAPGQKSGVQVPGKPGQMQPGVGVSGAPSLTSQTSVAGIGAGNLVMNNKSIFFSITSATFSNIIMYLIV